jgi:hypothetical protein
MKTTIRLAAVTLLIATLFVRTGSPQDKVLVIALEGARLGDIRSLADRGAIPRLADLIDSGVGGSILGGNTQDRSWYWEAVFATARRLPGGVSGRPVWELAADAGRPSVVVNVPGTQRLDLDGLVVLPGADAADGFIGDNTGRVVSIAPAASERFAWPYTAASEETDRWLESLTSGQTSEWIEVQEPPPDDRRGFFRIYLLDRDTAYLTPVYRRVYSATDVGVGHGNLRYVADDPSWATVSSRIGDYYARHLRDVTASRSEVARELAAGDWRLFVYFETLLAPLHHVSAAPDRTPADGGMTGAPDRSAWLDADYREVDHRVGQLVDAAGSATLVILLGSDAESPGRAANARASVPASSATGFFFASNGRGASASLDVPLDRIAPTILRLIGIDAQAAPGPLRAVVSRYWKRPDRVVQRIPTRLEAGGREVPLTPTSLEHLHLLASTAKGVHGSRRRDDLSRP